MFKTFLLDCGFSAHFCAIFDGRYPAAAHLTFGFATSSVYMGILFPVHDVCLYKESVDSDQEF